MRDASRVAASSTSPAAAPPTCRQWAGLLPQLSVKLRRILVPLLTTSVEVSLNGRLIAVGLEDASAADLEDASAEEAVDLEGASVAEAVGGVTLLRRQRGSTHAAAASPTAQSVIAVAQRFLSPKAAREIE
jgi:hypothetical protein